MTRNLKVALINFWTLRMRRGVETLVPSLANALAQRGLDVSVLTAQQTIEPLVPARPPVHLKPFRTFNYYESYTIAPLYAADLVRERYDFVVTFFADFGEGWALRLASPLARPRLALYLTFPYEAAPHRYHSYARWGWGKQAVRILADAEYTARRGEEFFYRPVQLLPSGTDPERFYADADKRAAARSRFGFGGDDVVLLNVAALEERKGVVRMIEAMPDVIASSPHARYLIFGEGPQKAMLQQRAAELGLYGYVIFAGTTNDLPSAYNAADMFVMLSDEEAGSIACLEAMASELPVVVSESDGFSDVVSECSGRRVNNRDRQAIAQACIDLAGHGALRQELGAAGRQVILDKFSWARIAQNLHAMFDEEMQKERAA